jgi:hypothetical protein
MSSLPLPVQRPGRMAISIIATRKGKYDRDTLTVTNDEGQDAKLLRAPLASANARG